MTRRHYPRFNFANQIGEILSCETFLFHEGSDETPLVRRHSWDVSVPVSESPESFIVLIP